MKHSRVTAASFAPVLILFLWTAPVTGQGAPGPGQVAPDPVITNAVADLEADPETLSLVGANFGTSPMVFMGDGLGTLEELVVVSSTDTFIQARLARTDPGTYLLLVSTGPAPQQMIAMDVTIGTVGPTGPAGPPGPGDAHSLDAADGDPADVVVVDNDGNVGIGTTTPAAELDVNGAAFLDGIRVRYSNGTFFEYEEVAPFPDGRWKIVPFPKRFYDFCCA